LLGAGLRYQLGNYGSRSDNYRVAFDFEPELRIELPAGLQARGRLAIPLWNNLDANTRTRPAMLSLNRAFRTDDALFGWISAGIYPNNRAGAQIQLRQYLPDERLSLFFELSHTRFTPLTGTPAIPTEARQDYTTYHGGGTLRLPAHRLEMSARYGQFLYNDQGLRLDMERQFGNGMVGFFLLRTQEGDNGGFRFRIPIPPARGITTPLLRIRTAQALEVNYRYTGSSLGGRDLGENDAYVLNIQQFYPSFLLVELESYIR
jgi:hypothetical protein